MEKAKTTSDWVKTNDYYNREVVKCDVYSKKITEKRTIYLQDAENFTYTFSCGANSDYSFTGCFFETTVTTLEQAMDYLDKFAQLWFLNEGSNNYRSATYVSPQQRLEELRNSIKIK